MDSAKAEKLKLESIECMQEAVRRGLIEWAASYAARIRSLDKILKPEVEVCEGDHLRRLRGVAL